MKTISRIFWAAASAAMLLLSASCTKEAFKENTEIDLARCLKPTELKASVSSIDGVTVTLRWNPGKDADTYNLVIASDKNFEEVVDELVVSPDDVPFKKAFEADETYYFKVRANNPEKDSSLWAVYSDDDGNPKSFKTYAVKNPLYLEVAERQSTAVVLNWDATIEDAADVDNIYYGPVGADIDGLQIYALDQAEKELGIVTIDGLEPSTQYGFTIYFKTATRGAVSAWTLPDLTGVTTVSTDAALIQGIKDGAAIALTMEGSPYTICEELGTGLDAPNGVKIYGVGDGADTLPVIYGAINVPDTAVETAEYIFEGVEFNGNAEKGGFVFQRTNGSAADVTIAKEQ